MNNFSYTAIQNDSCYPKGGPQLRDGVPAELLAPYLEQSLKGKIVRVIHDRENPWYFVSDDELDYHIDLAVEKGMYTGRGPNEHRDPPGTVNRPEVQLLAYPSGDVEVFKMYCTYCHTMVKPNDHSVRCVDPAAKHINTESMRRKAWYGDALHVLDVRYALLRADIPVGELESRSQTYTSMSSQSEYMSSVVGVEDEPVAYKPLGESTRQLATAFEANYFGAFREVYYRRKFGGDPPNSSDAHVALGSRDSGVGGRGGVSLSGSYPPPYGS